MPPGLQAAEQGLHELQGVRPQFTGHGCALHVNSSNTAGQAWPPFTGACTTGRVRCLVPLPHGFEHGDSADHDPTTQSVGHGWSVQVAVLSNGPQAAPPQRCGTTTTRVRVFVPVPHL